MKNTRKWMAVILSIMMMVSAFPITIFAEDVCLHENVKEVIIDATCLEAKQINQVCESCGEVLETVSEGNPIDHTPVILNPVAPSCLVDGLKAGVKCSTCTTVLVPRETDPAKGHIFGEPTWTWAEDGSEAKATFTCTQCTDEAGRVVETIANIESETELDSTCTVVGNTKYTATVTAPNGSTCTDELIVNGNISVKGHIYGEPTWTWAEDGSEAKATFTCTQCTDEAGRVVETIANIESEMELDSTCTVAGNTKYTATVTAPNGSTCTDELTVVGDIDAKGHIYGEPTWTWAEDGSAAKATFICTQCTDEVGRIVELDATIDSETAVDSTCTVTGNTKYTATVTAPNGSTCTDELIVNGDISVKGHIYGEPTWSWAEDGSAAKATFICTQCTDEAGRVVEITASIESETELDSTCTVVGNTKYTATVTAPNGSTCTDELIVNGDISVKGHIYGEPTWTWAEDGSAAKATFTCTQCTDEEGRVVELDATIGSETAVDSTCTVTGNTKYTATVTAPNGSTCTDELTVVGDIDVKGHIYGEPTWTWAEDGSAAKATFTCTQCTDEAGRVVETIANIESEMELDSTCTVAGNTKYTATVTAPNGSTCTDELTVVGDIDVKGHVYGDPTWSWAEDGKSATLTFVCGICSDEENKELTVNASVESSIYLKPRCTKTGKTQYTATYSVPESVDSYTAKEYSDSVIKTDISVKGHKYGEPQWTWSRKQTIAYIRFECEVCATEENHIREDVGVVEAAQIIVQPTCTSMGQTKYEANYKVPESVDTYTAESYNLTTILEDIKMVPHKKMITVEPIAATCTTPGRTAETVCTVCNMVINESTVVEPTSHSLYASVKPIEPTCTTDGRTATYICRICGEKTQETEVIPMNGHKYAAVNIIEATCTTDGYTINTCSVCGDTYIDSIVLAKGHDYKLVEEIPVGCLNDGEMVYTCSVCEDTYRVTTIKALGHGLITHIRKDPTCIEDGWKEYQTCSRCDYSTYEPLPMINHFDGNGDGICDTCGKRLNCGNAAHRNDFIGTFLRFFRTLFKSKCCDEMEYMF